MAENFVNPARWDSILEKGTVNELRRIPPEKFSDYRTVGPMPQTVLEHIFKVCDALWIHSGDPKAPHAELTKGKCSSGFVDTPRVLQYTNLNVLFAQELSTRLMARGANPDLVVGSDHASATFSYRVAEFFNSRYDFTEKNMVVKIQGEKGSEAERIMPQGWKRLEIGPGEKILQVEELVTTAGTLRDVREGIKFANPGKELNFLPVVGALIHRSPDFLFEGVPIIFLAHFDIETWDPKDCPLCANGSEKLRPRGAPGNWAKLVGRT